MTVITDILITACCSYPRSQCRVTLGKCRNKNNNQTYVGGTIIKHTVSLWLAWLVRGLLGAKFARPFGNVGNAGADGLTSQRCAKGCNGMQWDGEEERRGEES